FRQYMVYQGMGWDVPVFAHIPLIHGSDGAKLSKRHGALGVDAYRDMGFLPDAMFSYLLKLGWSYGDMDIISRDDAVSLFDLGRIGKSPARFNADKLRDVNAHFIRTMDDDTLCAMITQTIAETGNSPSDAAKSRIRALLPLLKERAKTHLDIAGSVGYLLIDGAVTIEDDAAALLNDDAKKTLLDLDRALETAPWTLDGLKEAVNGYLVENGMKMRDIGLPLRAAVTGMKQTPSIIDIMVALGQAETSHRLRIACTQR
ncbi:MAG: glutamate--tRNA ligase, partial [Candidatus Puniceispirillaceae bacterium]